MLHGRLPRAWELKAAPYFTAIQNFIDGNQVATTMYGMSNFALLRFSNHPARIAGGDLNGNVTLWESMGRGSLSAVAGWVHGTRTDSDTPLYQMMPLNARLNFNEEYKGLTATFSGEFVDRKSRLDPNRFEQATPGYAIFHIHAVYDHGPIRASAGVENLFNRAYELPMGGVNFDDFMAGMWMGRIQSLTGRGRSAHIGLTIEF